MSPGIFLRPLVLKDAETSYHWRNNPEIWKYTKFNPSKAITLEMEQQWLASCLKHKDQKRYAICLTGSGTYIGNIQLLDINKKKAVFHLFIGEPSYWGKGIGKEATRLLLDYAFSVLGLEFVELEVDKENLAAVRIYTSWGFRDTESTSSFNRMMIFRTDYLNHNLNHML